MKIEVASVEPLRVYAISSGPTPIPRDRIPAVTYRLFDQLADRLRAIGVEPPKTGIAWYERMTGEFGESSQRVWAGFIDLEGNARREISPVVLDGARRVAVAVHYGPMASIRDSWNELFDWVHAHGGHSAGYAREVHVTAWPLPEEQWVTRLELPFE